MKLYLLKEFESYKKLNVQANDLLYPIEFAPLSKGCFTVFLAHNLMTLESQMNQIVEAPLRIKVAMAEALISALAMAHEAGIIGFDIRPSTILFQEDSIDTLTFIGFVGEADILRTHLQWAL
jgi:serine/threonine protein kinase